MTVQQLIEQLRTFPPELEIQLCIVHNENDSVEVIDDARIVNFDHFVDDEPSISDHVPDGLVIGIEW